jgi:hypothetical protein
MQRAGWQTVVLCKFATWLLLYFYNKDFILGLSGNTNLQDDTQFISYVKSFIAKSQKNTIFVWNCNYNSIPFKSSHQTCRLEKLLSMKLFLMMLIYS